MFQVKSRRVARKHVVTLLTSEYPDRDYWLASDYEIIFDGSLKSVLTQR